MEQAKEIMQLRNDVNGLREVVENLTKIMNRKLMKELREEAENIESGEFLTEEEFARKHKVTFK
jgi:predicted lipid-binding transport protein (Tim44 family)